MVAVALKVTEVPEHIVFAVAPIKILTERFGLTVIVTALDVAGLPVAQVALEVITQVTTSILTRAALVYVVLFVPTFILLSFH